MKKLLLIAALAVIAYQFMPSQTVTLGPGVVASQLPMQQPLANAKPFNLGDYRITPLSDFDIEAKLLAKKRYRTGREADLSPYDLALGWGRMSDETVLANIDISQSGRWYRWSTKDFPIPRREIEQSSANMHMIPGDEYVRAQLDDLVPGQHIRLSGFLVRVDASDGWHWQSSLTRDDVGDGACELVYVRSVTLL
ncbi:hypothetical protein [Reinekea sp. G2M2-21]|uniref:hypothetical protein n=1 Tax=Reinekea sp. G2M2-21 TaxID=2788942 RepID=UPI0018A9BB8D|nr:hypothetical protein [Reinekea sp. G2M2-21]